MAFLIAAVFETVAASEGAPLEELHHSLIASLSKDCCLVYEPSLVQTTGRFMQPSLLLSTGKKTTWCGIDSCPPPKKKNSIQIREGVRSARNRGLKWSTNEDVYYSRIQKYLISDKVLYIRIRYTLRLIFKMKCVL